MVQTNCINKKVIIICGPTASGKTALAVECAKLLNSEVISADSMYIYKGLNVGTAKPDKEEMQGITHHLIDVISPEKDFSVSDYKNLAEPILNRLFSEGKTPVICGGTGFYINSLLFDLSYGNSCANLDVRNKYLSMAKEKGNEFVFEILKQKDPQTAEKLHFNDVKRVVRALEIFESGIKKSDIKDDLTPKLAYKAYSMDYERSILYDRINTRVDQMINNGLVEEVKRLLNGGLTENNQCMQAIGYKEIIDYLKNDISLEQAIELIKLNTRHYAKRQITFFKRLKDINYLQPENVNELAKRIIEDYDR